MFCKSNYLPMFRVMKPKIDSTAWHTNEIRNVFETVYGRFPEENELKSLFTAVQCSPTVKFLFRAVIAYQDHQVSRTPFTVRFSPEDVDFIPLQGFFLATDKADISTSIPIAKGSYEPQLLDFYKRRLKPGMTFVDVGANIGLYSTFSLAQLVGDTGKVISFEPNSENCRLILLTALKNHFDNITLIPMALSNSLGVAIFSTHLGSNGGLISQDESGLLNPSCRVVPTVGWTVSSTSAWTS